MGIHAFGLNIGLTSDEEVDHGVVEYLPRWFLYDQIVETQSSLEGIGILVEEVQQERYKVKTPQGWYWMKVGPHRISVYDGKDSIRIEYLASPDGYRIVAIYF